MKAAVKEVEEKRGREGKGETGWWDEECRKEKREVRRRLREWRKRTCEREYRKKRRKYKDLCDRKRRLENKRWKRKITEARREAEVWKVINRDRNKRKKINAEIEMGKWRDQFMGLEGVGERVVKWDRVGQGKG